MDGVQRVLDAVGRDLGQEAEGAQVNSQDEGVVLCGQACSAEEGAVSSERDDQVGAAGSVDLLPRVPPLFVLTPHVDGDAADIPAFAPTSYGVGSCQGTGASSVDDDAHPLHAHVTSSLSGGMGPPLAATEMPTGPVGSRSCQVVLIWPPSISNSAPVTLPTRGEARKTMRSATSWGSMTRPVEMPIC